MSLTGMEEAELHSEETKHAVLALEELEQFTQGLRHQVRMVREQAPDAPPAGLEYHHITIDEWRRVLGEWCRRNWVRQQHCPNLIAGFLVVLDELPDEDVFRLLEDLGR